MGSTVDRCRGKQPPSTPLSSIGRAADLQMLPLFSLLVAFVHANLACPISRWTSAEVRRLSRRSALLLQLSHVDHRQLRLAATFHLQTSNATILLIALPAMHTHRPASRGQVLTSVPPSAGDLSNACPAAAAGPPTPPRISGGNLAAAPAQSRSPPWWRSATTCGRSCSRTCACR